MVRSETVQNKIYKLYQGNKSNDVNIINKTNDISIDNLDTTFVNGPVVIHDTGEQFLGNALGEVATEAGKIITSGPLSGWYEQGFNIRSSEIPFIDFSLMFSTPSGCSFTSYDAYTQRNLEFTGHIWKMGSELIWSGPEVLTDYHTVPQEAIDNGVVLQSHCMPACHTTFHFTNGSSDTLYIVGLVSKHYDIVRSDDHYISGEFTSKIDGYCQERQRGVFVHVQADRVFYCIDRNIVATGWTKVYEGFKIDDQWHSYVYWVHETKMFSIDDLVSITVSPGRKLPNVDNDDHVVIANVVNMTSFVQGFHVYWDTGKNHYFYGFKGSNGDTLPYVELPHGCDTAPSSDITYSFHRDPVVGTPSLVTKKSLDTNDSFWVRKSKSTDSIETWKVRFRYSALVKAPATAVSHNMTNTIIVIYPAPPQDGGYWIYDQEECQVTRGSHGVLQYQIENTPVSARVIASYRNPKYYKKTSKFNINKS